MIDDDERERILEQYVRQAAVGVKHITNRLNEIMCECPFCGTSELKGKIWHSYSGRLLYSCWRASCRAAKPMAAWKWLKTVDPGFYSEYRKTLIEIENAEKKAKYDKIFEEWQKQWEKETPPEIVSVDDSQDTQFFYPITNSTQLARKAIAYCEHRRIPENIWKKFFVSEYGKYHHRMIIPFYHRDGKVGCFQGRALDDSPIKYLTRIGHTELYNIEFVDERKPLIVLEGPIDSMFIENATATCGAGSSEQLEKQLSQYDSYYLLDNDEAGVKKSFKLLQNGKRVFNWKKFGMTNDISDVKDINDLYLQQERRGKFEFNDFKDFFTSSYEDFSLWNRI